MLEEHLVRPPGTGRHVLSGAWGLIDATVFFIGPEIWIGWAAMRNGTYQGLVLGVTVAVGATAGAIGLYYLSAAFPAEARNMMRLSPDIDIVMFAEAHDALARWDALAVFTGAFRLVPFKLYAVEASSAGIHPGFLGVAAFFIYLSRVFLFAMLGGLAGLATRRWPRRRALFWFAGFWIIVYGLYLGLRVLD